MTHSLAKASALLLALSLALYASTLTYGFIEYDDPRILLGQPHLFRVPFWDGLSAIFGHLPREEPLLVRDISWLMDSHLFGFENPLGYHLGNIVLNAINVVLFFLFLAKATARPVFALAVAVLFSVLPVHVEPVSWVMGRKDLLTTFFMLSTLLLQARLLRQERPSRLGYAATVVLVVMAVLSKISAVVFFMVLFLHRVLHPHLEGSVPPSAPIDPRRVAKSALAILPHATVSIALMLWYQGELQRFGMFERGPPPLSSEHLTTLATTLPVVLFENLRISLLPGDLRLFYDFPAVGRSIGWTSLAAGLSATFVLLALLVYSARRRRDVFFFLAAAAVLLVPYLNLVYIGIWIANRYLYLFAGLLLAAGLTLVGDHLSRRLAVVSFGLYGTFLLLQTVLIMPAWHDNQSLWEYELGLPEPSMLAYSALTRVHVRTAEASTDDRERQEAIDRANQLIEQGLQQYRSLGVEPVPGYINYQRQYYAKLNHFRARVLALVGAPLEEQLESYIEAYEAQPGAPLHCMSLAETYFKLAVRREPSERAELAELSLGYFAQYAKSVINDQAERPNVARMLRKNYASTFPELRNEVVRLETELGLTR